MIFFHLSFFFNGHEIVKSESKGILGFGKKMIREKENYNLILGEWRDDLGIGKKEKKKKKEKRKKKKEKERKMNKRG